MANGTGPAPFVSRAVKAARGSASLRVTIPQVVASTLGLQPGDELRWYLDPHSGSVRVESGSRRSE
ncbi:MAG: AbrB/MazE/SpoVT family DNA-binding domain-containing protein [Thermoplasmata archaeon]|nr:AbrB/MazE/SpoVT family DNA-binding domain-containing protein [Thermoplasmata archaeon]MCI4332334.1 AbrB/MazE/SpoVT family DNA-binding domain-containing protein [Thermoplasmata archaeon]MCI4367279.1 AbrB/MazE/SpoVT family DNA-binding domain-containing protein [Thermoplasmata archaeon]